MRISLARSSSLALLVAAFAAPSALGVNLLTDPGFESNALNTATNVLNNFAGFQGQWGQEMSTRVGVDLGITPMAGSWQMRMDSTGGGYTQTFQMVDVTSYAGLINAGLAQINASAYLNTNAQAAFGGIGISFFSGNTYGTIFGPSPTAFFTLDGSAATWEQSTLSLGVPVGTQWVLIQTGFLDSSLTTSGGIAAGFVDDAYMEIVQVPAPTAAVAMGFGGLLAARRTRR